jgi:hypothetical protein
VNEGGTAWCLRSSQKEDQSLRVGRGGRVGGPGIVSWSEAGRGGALGGVSLVATLALSAALVTSFPVSLFVGMGVLMGKSPAKPSASGSLVCILLGSCLRGGLPLQQRGESEKRGRGQRKSSLCHRLPESLAHLELPTPLTEVSEKKG